MFKKILIILSATICLNGFVTVVTANQESNLLTDQSIWLADANSPEATPESNIGVGSPEPVPSIDSGDTAWMIVATLLVIMMSIPGLALFYGGLVRAKNMLSVLMQVFVTVSLMSILWAVYGYSLAATEGPFNSIYGGLSALFLNGINETSVSGTIPEYVFMTFQMTFACITPALIVGAFAERIKFSAVLLFTALWLTFCYVPIWHMVWGGGFLSQLGAIDFAGGTVVHINAGVAALIGCILVGKRMGYGSEAMPPHNLPFTMIGASLLWVGWFGFNVGSELAADGVAGMVLANTQLATSAAVLSWVTLEWSTKGKPTMLGAASGAIAGLVAITPACGSVGPMGAIILGLVAGAVCLWACTGLKRTFGYDDSLDVFGVHGIGGVVGAIGTGILMAPMFGGSGYDDGISMGDQTITQIIAVLVTVIWTGIISVILYKFVDLVVGLRPSEEEEREGLDKTTHGENPYNAQL